MIEYIIFIGMPIVMSLTFIWGWNIFLKNNEILIIANEIYGIDKRG